MSNRVLDIIVGFIFTSTVILPAMIYFVNFMAYVWIDPFLTVQTGAKLFTSIMVGFIVSTFLI